MLHNPGATNRILIIADYSKSQASKFKIIDNTTLCRETLNHSIGNSIKITYVV